MQFCRGTLPTLLYRLYRLFFVLLYRLLLLLTILETLEKKFYRLCFSEVLFMSTILPTIFYFTLLYRLCFERNFTEVYFTDKIFEFFYRLLLYRLQKFLTEKTLVVVYISILRKYEYNAN